MKERSWSLGAIATLALILSPGGLAQGDVGLAPPDPATDSGRAIRELYWVVFAVCAFVFVVVESVLVSFIFRYRRRRDTPADAEGPQIHGNTRLEIVWTIVPALILVGIAAFTFAKTPAVQATPDGDDAKNALRIRVEAHQFYWQYVYPDGVITLDRLRLPAQRPVTLELTSFDVIHSWWVPELTGKRDAIPGRLTLLHFTPIKTGTFKGRCAELCGILHARQTTEVVVMSTAAFEDWLARQASTQRTGRSDLGRRTFEAVCAKCHGAQGEGGVGPPVQGSGTLTNPEALGRLLFEGQDTDTLAGYMPPVGSGWPDRQVEALLTYLEENKTLSGRSPEG